MPLPFDKNKQKTAALHVDVRRPDAADELSEDKDDMSGLIYAAHDLLTAIEAKDVKGISEAFRAAFEILEAEPHFEAEHTNEGMGE
jgi:hypothetical protein